MFAGWLVGGLVWWVYAVVVGCGLIASACVFWYVGFWC